MQLNPRYDDPSFLRIDHPLDDPAEPTLRQRARLAEVLAGLTPEQWAAPSRCEGWTVQDVIAHLVTTNQFWTFSLSAPEPTRFLVSFDPVATPADLVAGVRGEDPAATLERFTTTNAALADAIRAVDRWDRLAEAPPGHIPVRGVVLHALWDSWIHERDIVLPLGQEQVVETDEVVGALVYAAALGLLFDAVYGDGVTRSVSVATPDVELTVELDGGVTVSDGLTGDIVLRGGSVELLEALSLRGPFPQAVPDEITRGLATVFDQ